MIIFIKKDKNSSNYINISNYLNNINSIFPKKTTQIQLTFLQSSNVYNLKHIKFNIEK